MVIYSEVNFPSLSSAIEDGNLGYDDGGKFEEVKDRGGQQYQAGRQDNYKQQKMDDDGFVAISSNLHYIEPKKNEFLFRSSNAFHLTLAYFSDQE